MEALMISDGLPRDQIAQELICFGAHGIDVFHGTKSGVIKQNRDNYALHSIRVHCMAHCTNLVVQTLLGLPLMIHLENLLQTLYSYFAHSSKRHFEFTKFVEFMQTKGNKISKT